MVFGEPALAEAECFRQRDLVQHLGVSLVVRHAAPLAIVEESEVHDQRPWSAGLPSLKAARIQALRSRTRGTVLRSGWTSSQ